MLNEIVAATVGAVASALCTLGVEWIKSRGAEKPGILDKGRRKHNLIIIMVALIAGALAGLLSLRVFRYAVEEREVNRHLEDYESLIRTALKSDTPRAYIIPEIVARWKFERVAGPDGITLEAEPRVVYLIHALRPISATSGEFIERFDTDDRSGSVSALPATEESSLLRHSTPNLVESEIHIALKPTVRRAVVTGAQYRWGKGGGPAPALFPKTGPNEGEFCYPTGSDLVGNLIIYVESASLPLSLNPAGGPSARVVYQKKDTANIVARLYSTADSLHSRRLVVAHFDSLTTNTEACVKVWW